jgi:hypothetical protein
VNASFAGVEEGDLQRHLAKLQRLLRGETAEALGGSSTAAGVIKKGPQPSSGVGASASAAPSISALYRDPEAALKDADLQNADDATVKEYKEKMNEGFSKNVVKPGDAGYEYDRRVEFKPVLNCALLPLSSCTAVTSEKKNRSSGYPDVDLKKNRKRK